MTDQVLNKDTLLKALKSTQQLRSSVAAVFDKLSDSSTNIAPESTEKDKQFLTDLRDGLYSVNTDTELVLQFYITSD